MIYTIENNYLSAKINSLGAELFSLSKDSINYIWKIDDKYWNKTSPVLFPVVGQLKNDLYTINGIQYSLSRHGFARDYNFTVIEQTTTSIVFSLSENKNTLTQYPFYFKLQIGYTLEKNKLIISYLVQNNSKEKMPFSIGAHPAFAIDFGFENYALQFENDTQIETHELENGLFSGKTRTININNNNLPLSYSLFEKDALVFKNLNSKYLTILHNNNPYLKVNFEKFPYLGIWTKQNAPFLCIEPWLGFADFVDSNGNLLEKPGIQIINEAEVFEASFSIETL
ncbi:MAG: aldose 1-epimerase family protein [Flavobacterium sp.]